MAGFSDLLGTLVQSGLSRSGQGRMTNALGGGQGQLNDIVGSLGGMLGGNAPSSSGGGLGGMLSGMLGGGSSSASGGMGGALGDLLGNIGGNKAALGGLAALGGALLGGGRGAAKGAIGGGAMALLASLAMNALKKSGQSAAQTPRALLGAQNAAEEAELDHEAQIIVKAMINAAKADGTIDQSETQRIVGKLDDDGLTQADKDFFVQEAQRPIDLQGIARMATGRPELAAEIYAASLLAIEVDTPAEQAYMQQLASALDLPPQAVNYIEESLQKI